MVLNIIYLTDIPRKIFILDKYSKGLPNYKRNNGTLILEK